MVQLLDRVRSATTLCDKCFQIANLFWSFRSVFGYTAAGAWIYKAAVTIFSVTEEEEVFVEGIPRAAAEAPRPVLLE